MQRVLVAGATGYLGRHLVAELKQSGCWVRVLVRPGRSLGQLGSLADDVFRGEATQPESLDGLLDGIDVVYSSLGITRQRDGLSYRAVDYQANLNLLHRAEAAGVQRFCYVSVYNGQHLGHLAVVAAKEAFVRVLQDSAVPATVIRPTGYFNDMMAFLDMARRGRVWLMGDGGIVLNPISGRDLARVCREACEAGEAERSVGGPEVLTQRAIGEAAFEALDKQPRFGRVPLAPLRALAWVLRRVTPVSVYGPFEFFVAAAGESMVAPKHGEDRLIDAYREAARPIEPEHVSS